VKPANALLIKGIIESMIRNYTAALSDYDSCLKSDPSIVYAYFNRATTRTERDETAYSEKLYSGQIGISRSSFGQNNLRQTLPPPNYKKSLEDYDKALKLNPNLSFAYYNRGNLKLKLKKYQRAIDDYSMAISWNPKWPKPITIVL